MNILLKLIVLVYFNMLIIGIDDAGRGPAIGPMVLAGVFLDRRAEETLRSLGVKDSKQLTAKRREFLFKEIKNHAIKTKIVSFSAEKVNELMENVFLEKIEGKKITQYEYLNLIGKTLEAEKLKAGSKIKKINLDIEKLEKMLNFDTFIDAKMALKMNLIDEIENAKDENDD